MPTASCWHGIANPSSGWSARLPAIRTKRSISPRKPSSRHLLHSGAMIASVRSLCGSSESRSTSAATGRGGAGFEPFTRAAPLEDAFDVSDDTVPADVQAADRAELARVTAAMARLPARLREALVLRTVDGLSQAEAAEVLSVSEKTIETRLYRARAKLKAQLGDRM